MVEGFATADALILKLVEGKMTWGEYNGTIQALRTDARAYLAAVAARQHSNPGLEDLAEDARQHQAAMVALENWKRQQQALVQKQRQFNPGDPARLNDCTYFSATVTCPMSAVIPSVARDDLVTSRRAACAPPGRRRRSAP